MLLILTRSPELPLSFTHQCSKEIQDMSNLLRASKRGGRSGHGFIKGNAGGAGSPKPLEVEKSSEPKRSNRQPCSRRKDAADEYAILNIGLLEDMMFNGYTNHHLLHPNCTGKLVMKKTQTNIISCSFMLFCYRCKYIQDKAFPTFHTVDVDTNVRDARGRKTSTLNLALGKALLSSPIGPEPFAEIFLRIGIDFTMGARVSLQRLMTDKANSQIIELAEKNMALERAFLKDTYTEIRVSVDGRYNNRLIGDTPFQAGTQSAFTVIENMTNLKRIIHLTLESKLCILGSKQRNLGKRVTCPNHKEGKCTADLNMWDSIGNEARPAEKSAKALKDEGINVVTVTNDGDAKMIAGFEKVFGDGIENLKCSRHFSKSHERKAKTWAKQFSTQMFPGKTKAQRTRMQKWFASDVREYCSASLNEAIDYVRGCSEVETTEQFLEKLNWVLEDVPKSIVACYKGDHDSDDHHRGTLLCFPEDKIQWSKSHLPESMTKKIEMTEEDECILLHIIDMRLGPNATAVTFRNTNTQKNEAVNRGFSKTNPKNVTNVKTWTGRLHAAVLNINAGFAEASHQLLKSSGHKVSSSVMENIEKLDKMKNQRNVYKKTSKSKDQRFGRRVSLKCMWEQKAYREGKLQVDVYKRGIDMPLDGPGPGQAGPSGPRSVMKFT